VYKPVSRRRSLFEDGFTLLYMGPLEPERFPMKSVIDMIWHLTKIDVKLIVVVAPRYKNDIQRIRLLKKIADTKGIGKKVHVIYGRIPLKEKVSLFGNVDAVIFPFLKSYKGAIDPPITLLEAMSCGGFVIAANALSIPWVIKGRYNGLLCSGITQLTDKINEAVKMSVISKSKIRENAVGTIKKYFSTSVVRERLLSFYEQILSK